MHHDLPVIYCPRSLSRLKTTNQGCAGRDVPNFIWVVIINPLWTAGWENILQPGRQGFLNAHRVTMQAVLLEKLVQQGHKLKM
jgi:hypothetical protein